MTNSLTCIASLTTIALSLLITLQGCDPQPVDQGTGSGGIPCPSEQWQEFLTLPESGSGGPDTELSIQCLPRVPVGNVWGAYPCAIIEARMDDECTCNQGRREVNPVRQVMVDELNAMSNLPKYNCFCEVEQLIEAEGDACRSNIADPVEVAGKPLQGFCVLNRTDKTTDLELLDGCGVKSPGGIRFLGDVQEPRGQTYSMVCNTTNCAFYPHE